MSRFEHTLFVYVSLETTRRDRFAISQHIEFPTLTDVVERVIVTGQLIEIGLKALAWGLAGNLGGKPWQKTLAGNVGGLL
jgi:hypothetical protein